MPDSIIVFFLNPTVYFIFLLGLIFGSFLNVVIYRLPRGQFFASQRSYCPHCEALIPFYRNIPLVSYLLLLGKSKCCNQRIHWHYPLVELLAGVFAVWAYYQHPFFHLLKPNVIHHHEAIRYVHMIFFTYIIIVCAFIDLAHMIIPDKISLPMIAVAPLLSLVHPELTLRSSMYGILLGGGIIYGIAWSYYLIRRIEGIGMGDAKLLAFIGGWLGYQGVLPTLLFGSAIGSIYGISMSVIARKSQLKTAIPFGPFLSFGCLLYLYLNIEHSILFFR